MHWKARRLARRGWGGASSACWCSTPPTACSAWPSCRCTGAGTGSGLLTSNYYQSSSLVLLGVWSTATTTTTITMSPTSMLPETKQNSFLFLCLQHIFVKLCKLSFVCALMYIQSVLIWLNIFHMFPENGVVAAWISILCLKQIRQVVVYRDKLGWTGLWVTYIGSAAVGMERRKELEQLLGRENLNQFFEYLRTNCDER